MKTFLSVVTHRTSVPLILLLLCGCAISDVRAQHTHSVPHHGDLESDSSVVAFVREARAATDVYHSLEAAIAAGYRLMGPDMPNMGEHWINPRIAVRRPFDPARPSVLTYVRVDGKPVLTGVAYTVPVRPGESPPTFPFEGAWHYHAASLEAEAFGHKPHTMEQAATDEPRLAMLHAWIWVENPDGLFTADNWALSLARLSLPAPSEVPPPAAKALFLLEGGVDYYARMVQLAGSPSPEEREAVRAILTTYRDEVQQRLARTAKAKHAPDLAALAELWEDLWEEMAQQVSPELWAQIGNLVG